MIEGLSHITFIVSNLERMAHFLATIFNDQEVYSSEGKTFSISNEKFFLISHIWIAIMQGETSLDRTYNHIAFKIDEEDFEEYAARIKLASIEVREGRSRVAGEGRAIDLAQGPGAPSAGVEEYESDARDRGRAGDGDERQEEVVVVARQGARRGAVSVAGTCSTN